MFVVLVRQAGWFGGSKPNLRWWSATKEVGAPHGCAITVSSEAGPAVPDGEPSFDEIYTGVLPRSATSPEVATWAAGVIAGEPRPAPSACAIHLGFGSPRVNIGDISTGVVKSFMDCLYPLLGGHPGAPEDWRVSHLMVEKSVPVLAHDGVRVRLWYQGAARTAVTEPARASARPAIPEVRAMGNPCRPGTAKWIVVEGALLERMVDEVRAELEQLKPGYGARLNEFKSDVRSENNLDIRIEGNRLVCLGPLRR